MKGLNGLSWLSVLSALAYFPSSIGVAAQKGTTPSQWPLHDNGLYDVVQWDHYSFKINGKRLFVFSGEIHYWRIPVPEVWEDPLEKIKAAGFTAFAFYGNWAYHSANNNTLDFTTGAHDFTKLFEIAQRFSELTSEHLVTKGGNAFVYQIENEYGEQWNDTADSIPNESAGRYMATLEDSALAFNGTIQLPPLDNWKVHDGLPEKMPGYNDSGAAWVTADHLSTPSPTKPNTLPVLYVEGYGFHNSFHLFRGYFEGLATGVELAVQGGQAFGWNAWLNGDLVGSFLGNKSMENGNLTLSFMNATIHENGTNVLLVAQDNTGYDLRAGAVLPRGILGAALQGANFTSWKIAGEAGGDDVQLDPVRGTLSEGGLTAERLGWHLPGFDDSAWNSSLPSTGFEGAGINFYRTTIPLDIPEGVDASFAFVLNASGSQAIRVQLFVNGYQYARFNPYIGHETRFPVPPGVLNYTGNNVIGLSVWAQSEEGAKVSVQLETQYAIESSWSSRFDSEYLRPGWTEERLAYA